MDGCLRLLWRRSAALAQSIILNVVILRGREFDDRDHDGTTPVAIVNQRVASLYWPGLDPIGRHIEMGSDLEIVGVVQNSTYRSIRETPPLTIYVPVWQRSGEGFAFPPSFSNPLTLEVRVTGDVAAAATGLRDTVRELDEHLPVEDMRTLVSQRDYSISTERTMAFVSLLFGGLATAISMVGVGALIAFGIASRTREIGIRVVLGARASSIIAIFVQETLLLLATGTAVGLPLAWICLGSLRPFVYGLPAQDPKMLATATTLVVVAGLAATLLPVTKAALIEPAVALRKE